jgi:general secretion pathway protein A
MKMYEHLFHFFGLRENPFHVSPDPRFYFPTRSHDAALSELQFGVDTRQGFIVLTGEAGTGKTTLLNHFLNWLQARRQSSSYVFHAVLKPVELLEFILNDFGVSCPTREKGDLLATLHRWLIQQHSMGDSPVVVIDEAQAISLRTLDQLRLLLNLETPGSKLLQIILAGQPELDDKLRRPELRQLHQRVMFRCNLLPLSIEETSRYVKSRLASAGAADVEVFAEESLEAINVYARGIPRTVNLLCEHSLLAAYSQQVKVITPEIIRRVATDFDLTSQPADPDEREATSRFGRLVPFRLEERSPRVAAEMAALESAESETIVAEPVPPETPQLETAAAITVAPALLVEETISLAAPATTPTLGPSSLPAPASPEPVTTHQVVTLIPKLVESPDPPTPKKLPANWQGPNLGKRFLLYWKEVRHSFLRDWRHFINAHGPATSRSAQARVARLQQNVIVPITKWLRQPTSSTTPRQKSRPTQAALKKQR